MFERNNAGREEYGDAQEFKFGDIADTIVYRTTVPYEDWMTDVRFSMLEDLCGCGRKSEDNRFIDLGPYSLVKYVPEFKYAYAVPEATVKSDTIKGCAFLDFVVNTTDIRPSYRNNESELAKIVRSMDEVKNDTTVTINNIHIHGFASPEAPWATNVRLSKGRTAALAGYVADYLGIPVTTIGTSFTPEDWEGLAERIPSSLVKHKDEIISLINGSLKPDAKEWKIKSTYPEDYGIMLRDIYPALRHSDYTITYEVKAFDIDEAKKYMKIAPKRLNLNEMYLVAQTCEPGSEDFNHVFEVAVRLYPENATANLNAANIAISEDNPEKAAEYLKKAGDSPQADHARALIAMLEGNYDEAEDLLISARNAGIPEAEHNLRELAKLKENETLYMTPDKPGRNPMTDEK